VFQVLIVNGRGEPEVLPTKYRTKTEADRAAHLDGRAVLVVLGPDALPPRSTPARRSPNQELRS
jgi:hypothetical protein